VAGKVAAVPGERLRVYWEGPPIWCALRPLAGLFLDQGIAVVGSTYAHTYVFDDFHGDDPMASLAAGYTAIYPNRSREYKVRWLSREFARHGVEAAVYHDARTSPEHSGVRSGIHIRLRRETGVHPLVIEGDTHDLRLVSVDHVRTQIQEYLEQRSAAAGNGAARDATAH